SELHQRYIRCVETGEPVVLYGFPYFSTNLDQGRSYEIRATRAGPDLLVVTWRDESFSQLIREAGRRQDLADERFRRSMDNAAIGMVLLDPDGGVLAVNDALCALFGYDAATMKFKTWQELTAPEFIEADQKYINELEEGRRDSYRVLKQYIHADGHRIWGDLSVSCVRDGDGQVDIFIAQIIDVTPTIEATERSRLLAENVADVVLRVDADGTIVWISPSVGKALGAPPEYWIGRKAREAVPPADAPAAAARLARALAGEVIKEPLRVVGVDGVIHWVHLHGNAFSDSDGRQDGVTAVLRLIDDEVAAQQEAEEARSQQALADARYRRVMDTAAIGMCLLAEDGTFLEVNPALCEMLGYDADTLIQKTWQELTPPEFLEAGADDREAVFDGRRDAYRLVKQYFHADGRRIWVDVAVNCVRDARGKVEHLASQITDITAEVQNQERLERSEKRISLLARSLQQKSDRLAAELQSAAGYMASIMPKELLGRVRVRSRYLPSQELGGDCFNYTWIDDDHLLVYLIDVSGHGIEPALLSVSVHNMLRSRSLGIDKMLVPTEALVELNRLFQMGEHGDHYFTIWYGVYQASTRTLRYASAGAPPALAFEAGVSGADSVAELSTAATPVGMFPDTVFTSRSYVVPPGCRILLCSDGAHEITLADDRQLSWPAFKDAAIRLAASSNWSLALIDELRALTPAGVFEDDCSLIELTFE
ncbi:MAG: PAS domain S-box protein, partial [Mycobacterium sp.]